VIKKIIFILLMNFLGVNLFAADKVVKIGYADWSSSIATSYTVKAIMEEKMGVRCRLIEMPADEMWKSVAEGRVDAILSAWLPDTHEKYYNEYKDSVVNLGANLKGTKIGLVIPQVPSGRFTTGTGIQNKPYMNIDSIPELQQYKTKLKRRIIGIDPEAGIMLKTREAIEEYNLDSFRLISISEQNMLNELERAIRYKQWIVVTGWEPHWIFARWDLKFLKDPKNVYGKGGYIATVVRKGLKDDMPEIYKFLDNFYWEKEDIEQVMLWIHQDRGNFPYEKALRWINANESKIQNWLD